MKEVNKINLAIISTILMQTDPHGVIYNGNPDAVMCKASALKSLGQQIMDIINDELKEKQ